MVSIRQYQGRYGAVPGSSNVQEMTDSITQMALATPIVAESGLSSGSRAWIAS